MKINIALMELLYLVSISADTDMDVLAGSVYSLIHRISYCV